MDECESERIDALLGTLRCLKNVNEGDMPMYDKLERELVELQDQYDKTGGLLDAVIEGHNNFSQSKACNADDMNQHFCDDMLHEFDREANKIYEVRNELELKLHNLHDTLIDHTDLLNLILHKHNVHDVDQTQCKITSIRFGNGGFILACMRLFFKIHISLFFFEFLVGFSRWLVKPRRICNALCICVILYYEWY